ncbi:MAG: LamG-like jellyroll fold domain-containing protein [Candidatus Paceibacterota bacterium]|jgi:prepilin-type N-terminal cleavage/methylation domain-containing protein
MNKLLRQAFTLIELLVVIAIIGILSGLIVVSMSGVTQKANIAKAQVFSNSLRNSLMLNIVGEWKFDDLSEAKDNASILDSWGAVNSGTLDTNLVVADTTDKLKLGTDCVSGKCLYFDGVDDYVDCANNSNLNLTNSFAISVWVKPISGDVGYVAGRFEATNAGYILRWQDTNLVLYYGVSSSVLSNEFISNTDWNLATISFSNNVVSFYRNGMPIGTTSGVVISTAVSTHNTIGNRYLGSGGSHLFNGYIDDVRIYNAPISASQVQEQYYVGLNSLYINEGITKEEYLSKINSITSNE